MMSAICCLRALSMTSAPPSGYIPSAFTGSLYPGSRVSLGVISLMSKLKSGILPSTPSVLMAGESEEPSPEGDSESSFFFTSGFRGSTLTSPIPIAVIKSWTGT